MSIPTAPLSATLTSISAPCATSAPTRCRSTRSAPWSKMASLSLHLGRCWASLFRQPGGHLCRVRGLAVLECRLQLFRQYIRLHRCRHRDTRRARAGILGAARRRPRRPRPDPPQTRLIATVGIIYRGGALRCRHFCAKHLLESSAGCRSQRRDSFRSRTFCPRGSTSSAPKLPQPP